MSKTGTPAPAGSFTTVADLTPAWQTGPMERRNIAGIRLGGLEAEVMDVLWAAGEPLGARELAGRLPGPRRAYNTVVTVLSPGHRAAASRGRRPARRPGPPDRGGAGPRAAGGAGRPAAGEPAVTHLTWAAAVLAAGIAVALAAARPPAARAAPRLGAAAGVLTLAGIGLMPPLLLACAAAALGTAARRGGHMTVGACVAAAGPAGPGQLALYGVAAALAARTVFLAARALRAARRAELRGLALAGAVPRRLADGGTAWIVPADQLAAHCAGLRRPRAVVSTGLLALLTPVGTAPLLSALAKVALAAAASPSTSAPGSPAWPAFAEPDDLRYRVRRLQQPSAPAVRAALTLRLAGALLTFALAWAACQALHASSEWSALVPCLAGFGYPGWRPTWRGGRWFAGAAR